MRQEVEVGIHVVEKFNRRNFELLNRDDLRREEAAIVSIVSEGGKVAHVCEKKIICLAALKKFCKRGQVLKFVVEKNFVVLHEVKIFSVEFAGNVSTTDDFKRTIADTRKKFCLVAAKQNLRHERHLHKFSSSSQKKKRLYKFTTA